MKKSAWVNEFLKHPREKRKKIVLSTAGKKVVRNPNKGRKNSFPPVVWTRESIAEVMKKHNLCTVERVRELARQGVQVPSVNTIIKIFGSFKSARDLFVPYVSKVKFSDDSISDDQLILTIIQFRIFTLQKYIRAMKQLPNMLINPATIARRFGSWNNLKCLAFGSSVEFVLERYVKLKLELGHFPTPKQCRDNGVDLDFLKEYFHSNELIDLVSHIEKRILRENQKGVSS